METEVKKALAASRDAHIHLLVDDGKRVTGNLAIKCYVADDGDVVAYDPEKCWVGKWPKNPSPICLGCFATTWIC